VDTDPMGKAPSLPFSAHVHYPPLLQGPESRQHVDLWFGTGRNVMIYGIYECYDSMGWQGASMEREGVRVPWNDKVPGSIESESVIVLWNGRVPGSV
jgi:hypothetical protein